MVHLEKSKAIQEVLNAFLAVFTQPLEQGVEASVKAAAMSIALAAMEGMVLLATDGGASVLEFSRSALVLVLVWMAVTSAASNVQNRTLLLARNLSVLSFWIAATMALIFAVDLLFPNDLDRDVRIWLCFGALVVLVPIHLIRSRYGLASVWMTLALWLSTGILAYRVIY